MAKKKDLILDYPIYSPKENDSLGKIRKYDFSEVKKNRNVLVSYGDFWKENKCLFLENPEAKKMLVLSASEPQYHNMFSYERELAGYYDSYLSAYMVDTSRT